MAGCESLKRSLENYPRFTFRISKVRVLSRAVMFMAMVSRLSVMRYLSGVAMARQFRKH